MSLYLVFVNKIGKTWEGDYLYEFLFSDRTTDVDGEDWDSYPASVGNPELPKKFVKEVGKVKTTLNLDVIQESTSFSLYDAVDNIVAMAYENLDDYDEYPEKRIAFNFGETKESVIDKLYSRDLILNFKEYEQEHN